LLQAEFGFSDCLCLDNAIEIKFRDVVLGASNVLIPTTRDRVLNMQNAKFHIISYPQQSELWHRWRFNGVGSSEASSILGLNRFKSRSQLLFEKLDFFYRPVKDELMILGLRNEKNALKRYQDRTGMLMKPTCVQHNVYSWLRASLDGICTNFESIVEIKCGRSNYELMAQRRSVPIWYKSQLQHILAATGIQRIALWCWYPGKQGLLRTVERDDKFIDSLLDAEQEFWFEVTKMRIAD
jgi:putative phage-type endonuclease